MPLPEILSAKEANWANTLRNMYIFYNNSVCLYNKSFLSEQETLELLNEDLITSGLSGVLSIITEITNEKKKLRIIDKERVKIYFSYGAFSTVALISSKYLPILFKKLEIFTKAFEKQFKDDLVNFNGKTDQFVKTDDLITKYFK